jgi:hypothetical protein
MGDRSSRVLGSEGSARRGHDDYVDFEADELVSQCREAIDFISVSIVDRYVLAFDIAEGAEFSPEKVPSGAGTTHSKPANLRQLRLLLRLGERTKRKEQNAKCEA